MNSYSPIERKQLINLIIEANKHPEKVKQLNQTDRKTLQYILSSFQEMPKLKTADIQNEKFHSLKGKLQGPSPHQKKDTSMTKLILKLAKQYISTKSIYKEVDETLRIIKAQYALQASEPQNMDFDGKTKLAVGNYKNQLLKLEDNLEEMKNEELIRKAKGILENEIDPKIKQTFFAYSKTTAEDLKSVSLAFDSFIKTLEKQTPTPLTNRKITSYPSKSVSNPLPQSLEMTDVEKKQLESFEAGIKKALNEGALFQAMAYIGHTQNIFARRIPEKAEIFENALRILAKALRTEVGCQKLHARKAEELNQAIEALSSSQPYLHQKLTLCQALESNPEAKNIERVAKDYDSVKKLISEFSLT